jgi:hypothetical protein
MLDMLAKRPVLDPIAGRKVEVVLDWMLHLRPRTEPFTWAPLGTKVLDNVGCD